MNASSPSIFRRNGAVAASTCARAGSGGGTDDVRGSTDDGSDGGTDTLGSRGAGGIEAIDSRTRTRGTDERDGRGTTEGGGAIDGSVARAGGTECVERSDERSGVGLFISPPRASGLRLLQQESRAVIARVAR